MPLIMDIVVRNISLWIIIKNKEELFMLSKLEMIKEISIVSHYSSEDKNDYKDLLRFSLHWISYTKTRLSDQEEIEHWSYKSHSNDFELAFIGVCKAICEELDHPHDAFKGKSHFKFNVRVTLSDGTFQDLSRIGTFADNNMSIATLAFLNVIPLSENCPEVISLFKNRYLTKQVLLSTNKKEICGFMYAQSGAMGRPGCMELITTDFHRYYTDGLYGRATNVSLADVLELFDGFHHDASYLRDSFNNLRLNGEDWIYINLGMNNHLLLRQDFFYKVGGMIIDANEPVRYSKWRRLTGIDESDNSCVVIEEKGDALENWCQLLCHQVNLDGVMGGGIALQIAQKFPNVEKEYANYPKKELGEVCFAKTDKYVIANCFSQTKGYDTDYNALRECLDKVVAYLHKNSLSTVAIPNHYGCGIAHGDWGTVRSIFEEKLEGFTLVIYERDS